MKVISYSELRSSLKKSLDEVSALEEEMMVKRPKGSPPVVIVAESVYNSMLETAYLLSTENNRQELQTSLHEASTGKVNSVTIDKLWK